MSDRLKAMLLRHEGLRLYPYLDTAGKVTIGVGRNLSDNGVTSEECNFMLERDIKVATDNLISIFPNMTSWTPARQDAMTDMVFNLGATRFSGFKNMISAIRAGSWVTASKEMLNSKWATQVGDRAKELARMVESGNY